jgi:transcriptional regulator with GAF, ATPase, and Fis domain
VGDDATRRVNVRVVAATNRDLQKEVAEQRFRLDLFYRLGVFPISVPPLRRRREDIPDLIAHFVRQSCSRLHVDVPRLPLRELDRARAYDWPGNVRELQNVVERAVILARGGTLELPLPETASEAVVEPASPEMTQTLEIVPEHRWRELERANVLRALSKAEFRTYGPGGAAELLGINAATLASRLKKLGIRPRDHKKGHKGV